MEELKMLEDMNRVMMRNGGRPTQRPRTGAQRVDGQGRLGSMTPEKKSSERGFLEGQRDLSGGQQHRAS